MGNKGGSKQKLTALVLFGFSLVYFFFAFHLKTGSLRSPGPGFFPLLVGGVLAILTLAHLIRSFLADSDEGAESSLRQTYLVSDRTEELLENPGDTPAGEATLSETFHPYDTAGKKIWFPGRVVAVSLCTFAYPLLVVQLKFVTATSLVSLGMLLAFRPKKLLFSALLSVSLAIGSFFFFGRFFGVPLPSGFIELFLYRVGG